MSDDHAAHALSCYGSRINTTPHLDRIAAEGARLNHCFCTNSLCAPSRAAILTGCYSHVNGLRTNRDTFDAAQPTFPALLRAAGYRTAMIGKWHLKSEPVGFDDWSVLPGQGDYYDPEVIEKGGRRRLQGYVTDLITDRTIDFMAQRDPARPFCALCWHKAPHRHWRPGPDHLDLYEDATIPPPETFDDDYRRRARPAREATMRIDEDLGPKDLKVAPPEGLSPEALKHWKYQRYIKDYLRTIASVDDNVGRLLDWLDAHDLTRDTIVVYTSDQGFFLGDHGWFDKRFMYEESLRMPMLVRWPDEIPAGTVADAMALNVDFAPTLLDCAGVAAPERMQGRSLRGVWRGHTPADWRTSIYYHYYQRVSPHNVPPHDGVRTDRFKLIHYYEDDNQWELFDLDADPHELLNVCDDARYASTRAELEGELTRLRRHYGVAKP